MKKSSLAGKVALVTGASRGLGKALSLELGRRGARVVMVARNEAALEEAAAEVRRETGAISVPLAFDVADKSATHVIAAMAAELGGEVDILVHNASALGPVPLPPLLDLDCEDLASVLETNLVGPFRLTKAVAGAMALRERGTIVFLSSDAAVNAYPGWGAYGLSKAAADHLART
ncbi:MAG: SDR family oxidoreductase, partial [Myxococcales bacterium]|nr:SDR family oxidoreductase [Myxococcales bacterium]